MSSISFTSSSSKSKSTFKYDVFLTMSSGHKHPLLACLEKSLREAGITAFKATMNLPNFYPTIESCRIIMVIFALDCLWSLPYWDSFLCGLETIIKDYHEAMNKPLVPVFWGVRPDQIRQLLMKQLQQQTSNTFDKAVSLSGFTLSFYFSEEEVSNLVAQLQECLFHKKFLQDLPDYHQVGLQLRVREVLDLLEWKYIIFPKYTIIVGIWGVGGVGKTTIARAIYDTIGGNFENRSFLANVKDVWQKDNGRVLLQNQLLSDISKSKLDEINDVRVTHEQMDDGPFFRKFLIVLDDVNQVGQLTELWGSKEQFGKGSLIFITTRDKAILDGFAYKTYEMKKLDNNESLQLFNLHAFKRCSPTNDFVNLSRKVITLCQGLPLALEVIGSLLHSRTKSEWNKVLNKLKQIPDDQIQQKLKISLDFLTNSEKNLFFDIVSLYVGQSRNYIMQLFKGSRFPIEKGMHVIIERNLVKVMNDKIHVHDLLQEIGRGISSNKPKIKYIQDVFLSFRGEDTRKSFATHLYATLKQSGVDVFMDEEGIERGENISASLLHAIEGSRISIVIFSKNYAGSSWCLRELEKIMDCYKTTYQEVFPIFYDVQPSDVRKQQNAFGKAWERLITRPSINYKRALIEVANLSGWDMQNYRNEIELIDDVIETITKKLDNSKYLFVAHHPVGLKSRMHDIIQLLSIESNDIIIAGIWGMGGIGKTTIAKAIYNDIGQSFASKSFLANVREVGKKNNGLIYLQQQLLSSILKTRMPIPIPNVEMGKTLIKKMLCQKRVLLVFDDVNHKDQLEALCGSCKWFGQGSRIIVTTRNKRLLQNLQVVNVYNLRKMDDNESMELFSWHAFKQVMPKRDFTELSRRVVSYSRGLPLALEILGSLLFDREMPYWESLLKKLQQIPDGEIYEILKISYDGLSDQTEKDIFLHICCFFIGNHRSYATQILDGCGLNAEMGITHLIERSLVKVVKFGNKNKLDMHDLIRDMGREIIRRESPEEPEKRTRLWIHDDVLDVLQNRTGTISIKGLTLNMSRNNSQSLDAKAFKKMKKLQLLNFDHVQLDGDYGYLSKELRWLCWHRYPFESLPMNFSLQKTVAIDLRWSNVAKVWEKSQVLNWLKILNLSHSQDLIATPDFSNFPYLEKLILKDCPCLSTIHPSIEDLRHLILLNLKDCKGLSNLPRIIYNLKSLKILNLFGCSKIEMLDEDIGKMESLTTLVASQTGITQVPTSLVRLRNIKYVSLCGYEGLSRDVFPSLVLSWMSPTIYSKSLFQTFGIMPSLIKGLSHPLFGKSHEISKTIPSTSQASCKKTPTLIGYHEQVHMERSKTFMTSLTIHKGGFNKFIDRLVKSIPQGCSERGFGGNSLPRDNYPHWLNFKGEGSSIFFEVPQIIGTSLKGLVLCTIHLSSPDNMTSVYPVSVLISNHTKATIEFYSSKDEDWHSMISTLEPSNKVEVIVTFACQLNVKKTIIYLVYEEDATKRIMY